MTKNERIESIRTQLKESAGNPAFINVTQLSKFLGVSRARAKDLLSPLSCMKNGREKMYLIIDVSEVIIGQMVYGG